MPRLMLWLGVGVAGLAATLVVTLLVGELHFRAATRDAVARLTAAAPLPSPATFAFDQLEGLPAPVARYFRAVLREGQPLYRIARLTQSGEFLVKPASNGWGPFTATHVLAARPAGFVWDARIRMAPGLTVRVRDRFVDGAGGMLGKAAGLVTVVSSEGNPAIDAGALLRYLAEAVWCPTALLPSAGVTWTAQDDSTATAVLAVGATTVSLDFLFGPDSLVRGIYAAARPREERGRAVPTPWSGTWTAYAEMQGMRVPIEGEVAWILPTGRQTYWRGRVREIAFE
jgi:hypothetical protein